MGVYTARHKNVLHKNSLGCASVGSGAFPSRALRFSSDHYAYTDSDPGEAIVDCGAFSISLRQFGFRLPTRPATHRRRREDHRR